MRIATRCRHAGDRKSPLQMTAMIDIVFLLLVFFILTFRVVAPEGDLSLALPDSDASVVPTLENARRDLEIRVVADADSDLGGIYLDRRALEPAAGVSLVETLHQQVRALVESPQESGTQFSATLRCDPSLKYRYLMDAITAVSGYRDGTGPDARIVPLVDSVQFRRPSG